MNGTINELKQGLLKCANENENRTYLTGQVIISSICKSAKDIIEELEKENEQLKDTVMQLRKQIDKMKNCSNCNGITKGGMRTERRRCKHCIKDKAFVYWELAE